MLPEYQVENDAGTASEKEQACLTGFLILHDSEIQSVGKSLNQKYTKKEHLSEVYIAECVV